MSNINGLIKIVADFLVENEKAYDLPGVCERYGLDKGEESEAYTSKRTYIRRRLSNKSYKEVIGMATRIAEDYHDEKFIISIKDYIEDNEKFLDRGLEMEHIIFISHSTKDKDLAEQFVSFLHNGLNIHKNQIFYTSKSGTIKTGLPFIDVIKENMKGSKVVIALISPNYMESPFCLAELGAAWILNQNIIPILVPPITQSDYSKTPLSGIQCLRLDEKNILPVLFQDLVRLQCTTQDNLVDFTNESEKFGGYIKGYSCLVEQSCLKPYTDSYYVAQIIDIRHRNSNSGEDLTICKVNGLFNTGEPIAEQESHWILFKTDRYENVFINDFVSFKLEQINSIYESEKTRNIYISDLRKLS